MKSFFIKAILNFLFNLQASHWADALELVKKLAADKSLSNEQRANRFLGWFVGANPGLKIWVAETVRNLAVGYARKKKWI